MSDHYSYRLVRIIQQLVSVLAVGCEEVLQLPVAVTSYSLDVADDAVEPALQLCEQRRLTGHGVQGGAGLRLLRTPQAATLRHALKHHSIQ